MTILIAIIVFGIMIGVHEAGHLIAAKLSNIYVHEFAIGMGPKIFSFQGKETKYSLRLLPIGGYCSIEGEDGNSDNPRAFCNTKKINRFFILVSGAVMNLILGFIVLILFYIPQKQIAVPVVESVLPDTYAYEVGLQQGDRIVKLNNSSINIYPDLKFFFYDNKDKPFDLTIERNGEKIIFENFKPYEKDGSFFMGINAHIAQNNFFQTIKNSFYMEFFMGKLVLFSLKELIIGRVSVKDASGPVGIVNEIGNAAKNSFIDVLYIVALITINLGLFNLLPLPALDGGRILFLFLSIILKRKIPEKIEGAFHATGMILLLLLMLFITFNDVLKLIK